MKFFGLKIQKTQIFDLNPKTIKPILDIRMIIDAFLSFLYIYSI